MATIVFLGFGAISRGCVPKPKPAAKVAKVVEQEQKTIMIYGPQDVTAGDGGRDGRGGRGGRGGPDGPDGPDGRIISRSDLDLRYTDYGGENWVQSRWRTSDSESHTSYLRRTEGFAVTQNGHGATQAGYGATQDGHGATQAGHKATQA